jgi:hypothetical protein
LKGLVLYNEFLFAGDCSGVDLLSSLDLNLVGDATEFLDNDFIDGLLFSIVMEPEKLP